MQNLQLDSKIFTKTQNLVNYIIKIYIYVKNIGKFVN
jgi:hypothetical protein